MMEDFIDTFLVGLIGVAIVWFISKRYAATDGPDHRPWGNWNTTYNAPPLQGKPVYLYPFYKTAELQE